MQRLHGAFEYLAGRQQRELRYLQTKKELQSQKAPPVSLRPSSAGDKGAADVRDQFNEQLATVEKTISLKSERATQPLGFLTNLMREQVSKLQLEDLDKQQSPSLTKLSINGSHLGAVNRTIEYALRQELSDDVKTIQHQLAELTESSLENLPGIDATDFHLENVSLRESEIWRRVENLTAIGKESHIELARKGFFDVLTAGRQKVFILIMFVSLMGRMGLPNLFASGLMRSGFGLFMASVLIGSMVNAIFVWRREKESQSEKEMSKIKDSLFNDGTKVIEQVEKGKLAFLRDYFRDVSKKFEKELKRAVETHAVESKQQAERQSEEAESVRQRLETQINDVTELGKQIKSLESDTSKIQRTATELIRSQARLFNVSTPNGQQQEVALPSGETEEIQGPSPGDNSTDSQNPDKPEESSAIKEEKAPKVRTSALLARREARRQQRAAEQTMPTETVATKE